jgi:hypothetical protein
MTRISRFFLFFPFTVMGACTKVLDPAMEAPPVLVEPLPLTIGVYYGDALRNHEVTNKPPLETDFSIKTGPAHVSFYNDLLADVFARTVLLDSKDSALTGAQRLDAVIEPLITRVDYTFIDDGSLKGKLPASILYVFRLYGPDGDEIHSWNITGQGQGESGALYLALQEALVLAMRDGGAKFVAALHENGALENCLASQEVQALAVGKLERCLGK